MKARFLVSAMIGIMLGAAASVAAASQSCTSAPGEQWKSEAEARTAVEAMGYQVVGIKAEDGCYEVKANRSGKRYEIRFDPTDMRMISRYLDRSEQRLAVR